MTATCIRTNRANTMELVRAGDGSPEIITGYASTFEQEYHLYGDVYEVIERGAFTKSLKEDASRIAALDSHDWRKPLARMGVQGVGGLELSEDDHGLKVRINPTPTTFASDLLINLRATVMRAMSFGFDITGERYERKDGKLLCRVTEARVWEVSPILWPANEGTDCMVEERSLGDRIKRAEAALAAASAASKRTFYMLPRRR